MTDTLQLTFENMTEDEKDDINKNLMSYNETHIIDIPPDLTPIHKYRASLGHKVNSKVLKMIVQVFQSLV